MVAGISWVQYEILLFLALWYIVSLLALWANKYLVYSIGIDTNILSLAQLGMSVICGVLFEVRAVGWTNFLVDIKTSFTPTSANKDGANRIKDMLTLGFIRILNLFFDLVALKYISVSLAQTIKSSAPFFTVILAYLVLGKSTTWSVAITLVPIVLGLGCCSFSVVGGLVSSVGLLAAMSANCTDCLQNVLSKKFLHTYTVSQLQLYSSIVATLLQGVFLLYMVFIPSGSGSLVAMHRLTEIPSHILVIAVLINGVAYFIQSALAYKVMSKLSPVSHSVASTLKRALLIILSIYRYGETVTMLNWIGISLVLLGVYFFNNASKQAMREAKLSESKHVVVSQQAIVHETTIAIV